MKFWDNAFDRLPMSRFVLQIFAIKSRGRRETQEMQKFLAPNFFPQGRPKLFYDRLLARFDIHRVAKFGSVPFEFETVCGREFMSFRTYPLMFHFENIGH